ncbi:MAG: hypothetical protein RUMPE_00952 [Eubacteriales bacterium SKADARSKE-1]|nr:hypothetical protein [Eubacteriales bacterium SKADARSKE-1]
MKIHEGVEVIGHHVFCGCTELEKVYIPETVTTIGCSAFYGCKKLKNVYIPESVQYIRPYAFENCIEDYQNKRICSFSDIFD